MRRALPLLLVLAAACTSSGRPASGPVAAAAVSTLSVSVTATSCTADRRSVSAGPLVLTVASAGALVGSEVELLDGARVLGEEEDVRDGHTGGFSLTVAQGSLQLLCLAGNKPVQLPLTVTKARVRHLSAAAALRQHQLALAARSWHAYVQSQLDQLVVSTRSMDDAIRAGDLSLARARYAPARVFYERVEPVAESFGDLDPAIDARIDDVADPALWTGFHRLEKALFADRSLAGMAAYATQLDVQVTELDRLAATIDTTGTDLANGATSLLEEVARTKITGEEERYSHVDLVDLAANVTGAQKAFALLEPAVRGVDPALDDQLEVRFRQLDTALAALSSGSGATDYPLFTGLDEAKRKALSDAVDAVSDPLSKVAAAIVV